MKLIYPPEKDGDAAKQVKGQAATLNGGKGSDVIILQSNNTESNTRCRLTLVDGKY
jgi:hypothetical protein